MVQQVERIPFSICFNSGLRRRRRQTFVRTIIEEDAIYIQVKMTDAKSENPFDSKYQK